MDCKTDKMYLNYTVELEQRLIDSAAQFIKINEEKISGEQPERLTEGTKVNHNLFGRGIILEVKGEDNYYVVQFERMQTPRNISFQMQMEVIQ